MHVEKTRHLLDFGVCFIIVLNLYSTDIRVLPVYFFCVRFRNIQMLVKVLYFWKALIQTTELLTCE